MWGRSTTLVLSLHALCTGGGGGAWEGAGEERPQLAASWGGLEFAHCSASCTIQVGSGSGVISNCAHPERGCKHLLVHFLPSGQLRSRMIQLPVPGAAASLGGGGICVCVHICAHMWERRELDVSVFPNHSPPHFFSKSHEPGVRG